MDECRKEKPEADIEKIFKKYLESRRLLQTRWEHIVDTVMTNPNRSLDLKSVKKAFDYDYTNASCMGKSRLLKEIGNKVFVVYSCFRVFYYADDILQKTTFVFNGQHYYVHVFKLSETHMKYEKYCMQHQLFETQKIIKDNAYTIFCPLEESCKKFATTRRKTDSLLLLASDHFTVSSEVQDGQYILSSHKLYPPYYLLGTFDTVATLEPSNLHETAKYDYFFRFGRPLWYAQFSSASDPDYPNRLVNLVMVKLGSELATTLVSNYTSSSSEPLLSIAATAIMNHEYIRIHDILNHFIQGLFKESKTDIYRTFWVN
ncbi:1986_t:CDS:2 [Funneliformis geosporum]|uniref:23_t:CDS:1 n=1 Tax=Funneliformis geosporum TaxID=1117311 RepID=A0A9W4SDY7_9GLOM|nr:1986_t:CDS:2 [Funneliformis geosporum]CAI2165821.1 23_t:CDS:2 [Funneliformis geosporum]